MDEARRRGSWSRWSLIALGVLGVALGPNPVGTDGLAHAQDEPAAEEGSTIEQADKYLILCELLAGKDQLDMALQACLMALETYNGQLGKQHPKTRRAAEGLVGILERSGKHAEAAKAREIFLGGGGPSAPAEPAEPSRKQRMHELAQRSVAAHKQGDYGVAIEGYEALLAMLDEDGQDDPDIARKIRHELADAYRRQLRFGKAEPMLRENLAPVLWALGNLHRSRGNYAKAEIYWRHQLAWEEAAEGKESLGLSSVLNFLAELYWAWGQKTDQIMPLAHRASALEDAPLIGNPNYVVGFGMDLGVGFAFNTDANASFDAHLGVGPGIWLGPFSLAPYVGFGVDLVGTLPSDDTVVVDEFIMDPALYWYFGGRARLAITIVGLEGYLVRTARGNIEGDQAVDIPDETRLATRAVIRLGERSELSAGFRWTDYDAPTGGAVGMGGVLSYGLLLSDQ